MHKKLTVKRYGQFLLKLAKGRGVFLSLFFLGACGGGGSASTSTGVTTSNVPEQPQNVQVTKGRQQVTLSWDSSNGATGYDICVDIENIVVTTGCNVSVNGRIVTNRSSPSVISSLNENTIYYFIVLPKNNSGYGEASANVTEQPLGELVIAPNVKLNDTGIRTCGDYADYYHASNNLDCNNSIDSDGDPIPAGQDASFGRDSDPVTNDDADGVGGFSFSKIAASGAVLSIQNQEWDNNGNETAGTKWSCVRDNVTGLLWEVKTNGNGLHNNDDKFTWFNPDSSSNGGSAGLSRRSDFFGASSEDDNSCFGYHQDDSASLCNTKAFVERVNSNGGLCGYTDNWRLPTLDEFRSIVNFNRDEKTLDDRFFPNIPEYNGTYWSSTPVTDFSSVYGRVNARLGTLSSPGGSSDFKSNLYRVMLVHSGE